MHLSVSDSSSQEPTIGAAFLTQTVSVGEGIDARVIRFELWDTAGQERYRSLAPMYYRGASAAVVVYDVTSRDSFEGAKSWVKELQRRGDPAVVIALAGNKADVREGRAVPAEEAALYAADHGIICMDTSAKTGLNVKEVFAQIGAYVRRRRMGGGGGSSTCTWARRYLPALLPRAPPTPAKKLPRSAKGREREAVADLAAAKPVPAVAGGCCG